MGIDFKETSSNKIDVKKFDENFSQIKWDMSEIVDLKKETKKEKEKSVEYDKDKRIEQLENLLSDSVRIMQLPEYKVHHLRLKEKFISALLTESERIKKEKENAQQ